MIIVRGHREVQKYLDQLRRLKMLTEICSKCENALSGDLLQSVKVQSGPTVQVFIPRN